MIGARDPVPKSIADFSNKFKIQKIKLEEI